LIRRVEELLLGYTTSSLYENLVGGGKNELFSNSSFTVKEEIRSHFISGNKGEIDIGSLFEVPMEVHGNYFAADVVLRVSCEDTAFFSGTFRRVICGDVSTVVSFNYSESVIRVGDREVFSFCDVSIKKKRKIRTRLRMAMDFHLTSMYMFEFFSDKFVSVNLIVKYKIVESFFFPVLIGSFVIQE